MKKFQLHALQLISAGVLMSARGYSTDNARKWIPIVAHYVAYFLMMRGLQEASSLVRRTFLGSKITLDRVLCDNKISLLIFVSAVSLQLYLGHAILDENFPLVYIAYLISQTQDATLPAMISYGVGMACSFFEGYLTHIIPDDGARFVGFQENIRMYESTQGVVFPVKRLFVVITKNLYCPSDMKAFNKQNREDLPYLECCSSLDDVVKSVAGVMNRSYKNSAYRINRSGAPPVYLAAEFATPLHTLHRVLQNRNLYESLCDVHVPTVVSEFCEQLERTVARSDQCRDKCVLVHFDETDPAQNLADVLLDKIREIEDNFEEIILRRERADSTMQG